MSIRIAVVPTKTLEEFENYLPGNYKFLGYDSNGGVLIAGEDNHGWTLDGYVIPRLASGMIFCKEVTHVFELKAAS
jgi:hypothetical protein